MLKKVEFEGQEIGYKIEGLAGKTLLALHGFLEDHSIFDLLFSAYADVQVIGIDLPGFGASKEIKPKSIAHMAEACQAVLNQEQVQEVYIVGHSLGGYVALELAKLRPVNGIFLLNSTPFGDDKKRQQFRSQAIKVCSLKKSLFVKQSLNSLFYHEDEKKFEACKSKLFEIANASSSESIIAVIQAMKDREDNSSYFAQGKFKQVIYHGKFDPLISRHSLRAYAEENNIQFIECDSSGHMSWVENPEGLVQEVSSFANLS